MVKYNTNKSEHPLPGKGLLFSLEEENRYLKEDESQMPPYKKKEEGAPTHRSWPIAQRPIDQGLSSSCVGYTWAHYLYSRGLLSGSIEDEADEIYRQAQSLSPFAGTDEDGMYGATILAPLSFLFQKEYGSSYRWTRSTSALSQFIMDEGPAIATCRWRSEMMEPDRSGIVRPGGRYVGNHSFLVYGTDDMWETFFCVNSWGNKYGKAGKFVIKASDMKSMFAEGGFALAIV